MNPDPKYAPVHMRARLAGFERAQCHNCMFWIVALKGQWCSKHAEDPHPDKPHHSTVCTDHMPQ